MIYTFKVVESESLNNFLASSKERFSNQSFVKKFYTKVIPLLDGDSLVAVLSEIAIPPVYLIGIIPFVWGVAVSSKTLMITGLVVYSLGFIWSKAFQSWCFKQGLKKSGYNLKIQSLNDKEALELITFGSV